MSLGDLFISYSRTDRDAVASIAKRLDRVYGQIWFDRELFGGQDWWQEILSQIANCDVFIYMISPDSIRSEYCVAEYNEARRLNKPIVPIMVRSYLDLPKDLRQLQIIDISLGVTEDNLTELYAAINYHLPQVVAAKTGGALPPKRSTTTMHKVSNTTPKPQPKRAGLPILPLLLTLLVVGGAVGGVLLLASQQGTAGGATETSQALAAANTQDVTSEPSADAAEPTTALVEASDQPAVTIAPTAAATTAAPEETTAPPSATAPAAETTAADTRPLEDAPIHLIYTDEDFVLYNRTGQFQDVSGLTFARTTSAGRELRFVSGDWDNNFVDVAALRGGACVQVGRTTAISSDPPDFCSRLGWLAPNSGSWFWTDTSAESLFTVTRDGVQLAECPVAVESDDHAALTCGLYLTPPQ